jgi:ABC-type uncharacterized transport system auxiliary subunit
MRRGEAVVEIAAQIIGPNGRIVGGRLFAANAGGVNRSGGGCLRLDAALAEVVREIVIWTAPKI